MNVLDDHLQSLYRLRRFGIKLGLDSISRLLRGLGNPQDSFRCVHIAGTNGKGSVAALLSSILSCAGYRVGLYTSPHLVRFNERIQINGRPISDEDAGLAAEAALMVYAQGDPPTFFECATAMAFSHFARMQVDWAVIETGMGGRYDATNVVRPEACVITNVGLEHTEYLGKRLYEIAFEKAGIIKSGAGVVTGIVQKKPLQVVQDAASAQGVPLLRLGKEITVRSSKNGTFTFASRRHLRRGMTVGLAGYHQIRNAAMALGALDLLEEKGVHIPEDVVRTGLTKVRWPGRLETVSKKPWVVLDGAHNPAAVRVLTDYLEKSGGDKQWILVIGVLADKNWKGMLSSLASKAHRVILTRPSQERAADPQDLSDFLKKDVNIPVSVTPNVAEAISQAVLHADGNTAVCVTGSLYTVGEAKAYFDGYL